VEDRLRDGSLPTTAVCTSTLELGIDIGDVVSIAQVGAPPSVSALKQRIGRSGRRKGQAQTLRGYVLLPALDAKSHLIDWLRLPLVQCMASIECMIAGEFEPAEPAELNLSTLTQQILSVIAQSGGGLKAASLYDTLCASGSFRNISPAMFADV